MIQVTRRHFLTLASGASASLLLDSLPRPLRQAAAAEDPLARLMTGNKRYVSGKLVHPNQGAKRRAALTSSQQPFAAILSCADSRVPPEVVFDQGLGDLFVVRAAGNVADNVGIGSLEYAVAVLEVPVVMVLGHSRCGAVDAAMKTAPGTQLSAGLGSLVEAIRPAVAQVKDQPGDMLANAVRANIVHVVDQLKATKPTLEARASQGKIKIVGAHYDLATGVVALVG
jgi:carbonic anhydrase